LTWIAPDVERSEGYPARRNEPEREMLRDWLDWLDWHRATLLRKCAGLDATVLAKRSVPLSNPCRDRSSWNAGRIADDNLARPQRASPSGCQFAAKVGRKFAHGPRRSTWRPGFTGLDCG
jgi:hypothetical protein